MCLFRVHKPLKQNPRTPLDSWYIPVCRPDRKLSVKRSLQPFLLLLFLLLLLVVVVVCVSMNAHMPWHVCGNQRTTSCLSSSSILFDTGPTFHYCIPQATWLLTFQGFSHLPIFSHHVNAGLTGICYMSGFRWVLGIQTQLLKHACQVLYHWVISTELKESF